jgi:hypothetical protein
VEDCQQWLGRRLSIEDKAFKPYDRFGTISLYWPLACTVIPPVGPPTHAGLRAQGLVVWASLGTDKLWRLDVHVPLFTICGRSPSIQ